MNSQHKDHRPLVGVGLRHPHIAAAQEATAEVDFIEVHSENFFADGGALPQVISDLAQQYPISLHSTAMGLGSATAIPQAYIKQLTQLADNVKPLLISDHACFAWGNVGNTFVHAGDLLPIAHNRDSLITMANHIEQIQQPLGKQLLIENLSAYIAMPGSTMTEAEFLAQLTERTGCGLLVDLNNLLVNAHNANEADPIAAAMQWLSLLPKDAVGEFHLAGFSEPKPGDFAIDDHSQPVSEDCWQLYQQAITLFGPVPTLIEWDNDLPSWDTLVAQAQRAKHIAAHALNTGATP